jgi:electron transport complex protein RnfG
MKTQSVFAYVMRITLTLLLIASVVAAALALINQVTEPIIEQKTIEKTQKAIAVVLPGGYHEEITDFADDTGLVSKVYKGANGYAMEVTPAGFDNTITMMVGVDFEGTVLGISIISHTESAGLGAVAAGSNSAGVAFRDQFIGLSGSVSVSKDGGTVDAITNATITSRAVCDGVNAALACAAKLG